MRIRFTCVFTVDSSMKSTSAISVFDSDLREDLPLARGEVAQPLVIRRFGGRLLRHPVDQRRVTNVESIESPGPRFGLPAISSSGLASCAGDASQDLTSTRRR